MTSNRFQLPGRALFAGLICLLAALPTQSATKRPLELRHQRLQLPGPPAAIIPVDLDGDGRLDLFVVTAHTEVEQVDFDRFEDMMQISTVIPTLFDRREGRAYLAGADGEYTATATPLELPGSVLAIAAGPAGEPLLALTDDGVSGLRLDPSTNGWTITPIIEDPPALAGSGTFYPKLEWVMDLDGDGLKDLLLPSREGPAIYLRTAEGFGNRPVQRLHLPGSDVTRGPGIGRRYPWPKFKEIDGDGKPDLAFVDYTRAGAAVHLFRGTGDGRFVPPHAEGAACRAQESSLRFHQSEGTPAHRKEDLLFLGDLDGDGRAEAVTFRLSEPEKDGLRAGMKQAKRPSQTVRLHRLRDDLAVEAQPYSEFDVIGHANFDLEEERFDAFRDLDGDGLMDLITVTLDFSLLQAVRVMATKRISIGLDFHVWAQQPDATFVEVEGLDLSEKLRLDLNDLRISRFAQFAGDFDGDGMVDFVHFGRGKQITIHRGQPGCRYPRKPDLAIDLKQEPRNLELVRVADLNGDDRSDLSITHLLPALREDESPPIVLDLYVSVPQR